MENPLLHMQAARTNTPEPPRVDTAVARSGIDHAYMYAAIFALLGAGAAIWLSHSIQFFAATPAFSTLLWLGLSACTLAIVMLFQSLLLISRMWNIILIFIEGAALLASFYNTLSLWVFGAAAVFCVLSIRGYLIERSRLEDDMKFQFFRYANRFDGLFFTAFTLFCAMLLVGMFQKAGGISEGAFELLLRGVTPALSYSLKTPVTAESKIEGIIALYLAKDLTERPDFIALSQPQREAVIRQSTAASLARISEQVGVPISRGETVGQYVYRLLEQLTIRIKLLHLGPAVAIGFLLLIGLFIRSMLIFVKLPTLILAQIIYAGLSGLGIISIATEPRLKEVVVIK